MILMHQSILDVITGFDETAFSIFCDEDQPIINELWIKTKGDILMFMRYLSPEQKICIAHWMSHRITYPKENLVPALKKFTKYLESSSYKKHSIYPKHTGGKKKRFFLP